jgi:serine phosphatase RsbU (regulator of sigma subunit)
VAATLIMVEPHTHRLEIWNGGSPAAYLIDNAERTIIKQFPARHPPLGVLADDEFDVRIQSHSHRPEYTLVACTDGVVEAESADGSMFGSRGFEELLVSRQRSDDILDELDRTLDRFTGGGGGRDDRTLLVLPLENLMPDIPPVTVGDTDVNATSADNLEDRFAATLSPKRNSRLWSTAF